MKLEAALNESQLIAATHIEGPLLVVAGAGSGKTRIVTHRVSYLLSLGIPASEILCVTFTNKAAKEMQKRIHALSSQSILACTFHSVCCAILRESIHYLGLTSNFTIYDQSDSEKLIKACIEALGLKPDKVLVNNLKSAISEAKNDLIGLSDLTDDPNNKAEHTFRSVYSLYQERLKAYNAVDFDDLLFLTATLFKKHPDVLTHYQNRWPYLLVDEYQDTNHAQYSICKMLAGERQNLFVVGDPDQSIYSWRGANIQNILNFEKDFPGAKVVTLEENYRSTNLILQAANALIQNNVGRYEKNLWSQANDGEKIELHLFENGSLEARFIVEKVLHYQRMHNIPLSEMVIFYRTNAQSRSFEDQLLKAGIPYTIVGNLSFYQRKEIKDALSYLRLLVCPADFISFIRIINQPKRGIGPAAIEKLKTLSERISLPIIDSCRKLIQAGNQLEGISLPKKPFDGLCQFIQALDHLTTLQVPLSELIIETLEETGYLDFLKLDAEGYNDRKENLSQLIAKAREWENETDDPNLNKFLEELSLKSAVDEVKSTDDSLKLMTLHNGKGLEFTLCFLVGMEEDLFPHTNSKDTTEGLEEERRLCYVGMTRAKQHLYLTAAKYRLLWGNPRLMRPSRFLDEIPSEFIRSPRTQSAPTPLDTPISPYREGEEVYHRDFGRGTIKKLYDSSLGPSADVYFFDDMMTRSLILKYAKLIKKDASFPPED
ncbi:MAG: ATP-dependent DNA helicase PcrA [Chlamydiia bacterium]|nr:ATP-dependent DNA helicase PcrA [Chlamydiia bacterium]